MFGFGFGLNVNALPLILTPRPPALILNTPLCGIL